MEQAVKHAEVVAKKYMESKAGHTLTNLIECIRLARRDALSDLVAWCHQHPDAPGVIRFIHNAITEGNL
jgi:hypothetical protein